ncbi:hypothetical protein, partial [Pseudomonas plecoglossicida]
SSRRFSAHWSKMACQLFIRGLPPRSRAGSGARSRAAVREQTCALSTREEKIGYAWEVLVYRLLALGQRVESVIRHGDTEA